MLKQLQLQQHMQLPLLEPLEDTTLAILCKNITKAVRAAKIMAAIYEFIPNEANEVSNALAIVFA